MKSFKFFSFMIVMIMCSSVFSSDSSLKEVTNEQLEVAIKALRDTPNDATQKAVFSLLSKTTFLIATTGQNIISKEKTNSNIVAQAGNTASFIMTSDGRGNSYIPVFTSWSDLEIHNKRSAPIWENNGKNAIALHADELWEYAIDKNNNVYGIVINPSTTPLPLNKNIINALATK